jgi:hypothetical protein
MDLSEEQIERMLKDPLCQGFIEAMATILVHLGSHIEEERDDVSITEDGGAHLK